MTTYSVVSGDGTVSRMGLDAASVDRVASEVAASTGDAVSVQGDDGSEWSVSPSRSAAERVADEMGGDGMKFVAPDGRTLEAVCEASGSRRERRGTDTRYVFADRSTIVVSGGAAWDVGISPECWCWVGGGHAGDCSVGAQGAGAEGV